ncbi:GIY-YIG nuclease family protein [Dickeya zeae]|uniref:GIY-YIG nuclease family protein n=1 Tax=Dickeya zeae TaxID=204042 RepID=UPI0003A2E2AD|nr:GIY-YIG nuclease family protein [Dickeya zeae]
MNTSINPRMQEEYPQLQTLPPLANVIIDKTVDNVVRKLVGGYRNKRNSQTGEKNHKASVDLKDTLTATSVQSVLDVANRGVHWKELICKTFSHGISSLSTMKFDGQFTVKNGVAEGLNDIPETPGIYVVFDKQGEARYIGDAKNIKSRWYAGHLNENKQCQRQGKSYKLASEFEEGCTVRFISLDSVETAAAIEAHILKTERPPINSKEELKHEQGIRSNIEAKKMKESMGSAKNLLLGAGKEAVTNVGWDIIEQLTTTMIKTLKDELVDLFITEKVQFKIRIKRFIDNIWQVISRLIKAPLSILKGIFEFVINALCQTIGKIYQLAKNIYDLGISAVALVNGAKSLTREELITKISEVIITSGALIFWDALEPFIESGLTGLFAPLAPFSPYISSTLCAIGFGVTSYYLSGLVPKVIGLIVDTEPRFVETGRNTYEQLLRNFEMNADLVDELSHYANTSAQLISDTRQYTQQLNNEVVKLTRFSLAEQFEKLKGN